MNEDETNRMLCNFWRKIFGTRVEVENHHCHETIMWFVQTTPGDIQWRIDWNDADEMMVTKESALDLMVSV